LQSVGAAEAAIRVHSRLPPLPQEHTASRNER